MLKIMPHVISINFLISKHVKIIIHESYLSSVPNMHQVKELHRNLLHRKELLMIWFPKCHYKPYYHKKKIVMEYANLGDQYQISSLESANIS